MILMPRLRVFSFRSGFSGLTLGILLQASVSTAGDTTCVPLVAVDIEASKILSETDQSELINPFLDACIDGDLIRSILSAISSYILDEGYVTSRPYLLEQDISDGQIEIRILVGTIEAIIDADSGTSSGKIATAFAFHDEVLNLRELETSLEAIERVESVSASFEIRPGTQQGASIVAVKTTTEKPFRTELGINAQTGLSTQLSFQAALDNPLDINDLIEFRYNDGEMFQAYQDNQSRELVYSFPLGSYLFALTYADLEYEQRVQGINGSFLSEGDTISNEFRISKVVSRSQTGRLTLAMALELKDSDILFDKELIDVSSYRTSQAKLELRHDWFQAWGQLSTVYSYHRGLDSFGARDDDYFTFEDGFETDASLQFEKSNIDSQLYYYLTDPAWYASFKLSLQYSDDILYDNDKLYLGSPYTVRGYSSALSGSNAWYLRSDLTHRWQSVVNPFSGKPSAKSIALSVGVDYGEVKCEIDNRDICGEIYGVGLGAEIADENFNGRLIWAQPLREIGDDIGDEDFLMLDVRWLL
jgi:hemolysin activation/secretion protein